MHALSPYVVVMKVGVHGSESLETILERKRAEELGTGVCLWGYGGSTCHPLTQVRALNEEAAFAGGVVDFVGIPTDSQHHGGSTRATEYSLDGRAWSKLDPAHRVTASRYALVISGLTAWRGSLQLDCFDVAVGAHAGSPLPDYLRGRVDKACVRLARPMASGCETIACIRGQLTQPSAILVR